ncbi:uncharacterized protein PHALS_12870 [Plasmopara halstedii]|uniref:Uncharacterized protein n=1 Tax=Plasmopara halstedii TaxID=4781 RepID=A0A0P1AMP8_PLAHL|nr:uncharacterized protein PHALS_12870 [Plasmopara halstedii]CEG42608.1 hypothetical protein PHALS_12870 [Plasmopara halstedii]|eukprot:XP_024578977.1 hypothetical protein PHALS_12870 [Plasmopara halstedii]
MCASLLALSDPDRIIRIVTDHSDFPNGRYLLQTDAIRHVAKSQHKLMGHWFLMMMMTEEGTVKLFFDKD